MFKGERTTELEVACFMFCFFSTGVQRADHYQTATQNFVQVTQTSYD